MSVDADGFHGIYRGIVQSNKDPLNQGRLRLKVPQLLALETTNWAWGLSPSSSSFEVPAVGQGVWVMFEGGNVGYPLWVGVFGKETSNEYLMRIERLAPANTPTQTLNNLVFSTKANGQKEVNLTETLVNITSYVEELHARVASLEGTIEELSLRVTTLETT